MSQRILREDRDGLCTLTLNRPEKLNALDNETFRALDDHLAALEQETDKIGCVILHGAGRAFCAGMDLTVLGREAEAPEFKPSVIDRLARLPQPVIGMVRGACYTGGLELALACDFLVADGSAKFADTHGKWGLVATWGLFQRLPRRMDAGAAKRMMMTSAVVMGAEALQSGLVDILAPDDGLDAAAGDLAAKILANSWHVNFAAKRFLRETDGMGIEQALAYERTHYPGHAPDHRDRVDRFSRS